MIQFNQTQHTILKLLEDGACHSGTDLGKALEISRSAIWKQVNQLISWGIPIKRIAQQGYQLQNDYILLDKQAIVSELEHAGFKDLFNIHVFASIDSTNRYLKELPPTPMIDVCCAESQTQGRGRFGRQWHSPFGENIYCSSRWQLNTDLAKLSGLSLVISLAIMDVLSDIHTNQPIKIKWPNDILWGNKKLCGILIEITAESNGRAQVIIGVGLNVNSDTENKPLPDKPWCSLYEMTQTIHNRNQLIAKLIISMNAYIAQFLEHDLDFFMNEWKQFDYLANKNITINQGGEFLSGVARGIDRTGLLLLEQPDGIIHPIASGDASLHF
jgi:BirA family biotin operon repressor/biotin-[acetyl-CoA-carboxylase] ligase